MRMGLRRPPMLPNPKQINKLKVADVDVRKCTLHIHITRTEARIHLNISTHSSYRVLPNTIYTLSSSQKYKKTSISTTTHVHPPPPYAYIISPNHHTVRTRVRYYDTYCFIVSLLRYVHLLKNDTQHDTKFGQNVPVPCVKMKYIYHISYVHHTVHSYVIRTVLCI